MLMMKPSEAKVDEVDEELDLDMAPPELPNLSNLIEKFISNAEEDKNSQDVVAKSKNNGKPQL